MKKSIKVMIISFLVIIIGFGAANFILPSINTSAYIGVSGAPIGQALLSATNTYDCEGVTAQNLSTINTQNSRNFATPYKTTKNNNGFMSGASQITFLNHSLGGRASDWSNVYDANDDKKCLFAYDSTSLINQLSNNGANADVYWARVKNNDFTDFDLFNITQETGIYDDNIVRNRTIVDGIFDPPYNNDLWHNPSKHIIIVFQAAYLRRNPNAPKDSADYNYLYDSHNTLYFQFNFVASKIIYDVAQHNNGLLPKINLIGYSRGGVINLLYALDHPDLVVNMISIDTPYIGTTTGNVNANLGYRIIPATAGYEDVINSWTWSLYLNRWNNNYDTLYKHINVLAIGGYSTLDFLWEAWTVNNIVNYQPSFFGLVISGVGKAYAPRVLKGPLGNLLVRGARGFVSFAAALAMTEASPGAFDSLLYFLYTEADLGPNILWPATVYNDIIVDLPSQLGNKNGGNFKGFQRKTKLYTDKSGNCNFYKAATRDMPPVAHSLAPRDSDVIDWVVDAVKTSILESNSIFTVEIEAGNAVIKGLKPGAVATGTLTIPSTILINGINYSVNRIASYAFARTGFTGVSIPSSVRYIGDNAFEECKSLATVTRSSSGSDVINVYSYAFAGCTALSTINLGSTTQMYIRSCAFENCTSLNNINLSRMEQIGDYAFVNTALTSAQLNPYAELGEGVFAGCKSLQSITTSYSTNDAKALYSTDGVLYRRGNNGNTLICYPDGKTGTSFNLPNDVTGIKKYAFAQNSYLKYLNLGFITDFEDGTFAGLFALEALYTASANTAFEAQDGVLYNKNTSELVIYPISKKAVSFVVPTIVTRIADYAFLNNSYLQNITIGKNCMEIGVFAFGGCSSLKEAFLTGISSVTTCGVAAFIGIADDFKVYVAQSLVGSYKENTMWMPYANIIEAHTTVAIFNSLGGSACLSTTIYYGGTPSLPIPTYTGYTFAGWYDSVSGTEACGNLISGVYYGTGDQITLYAKWIDEPPYEIISVTIGSTSTGGYTWTLYSNGIIHLEGIIFISGVGVSFDELVYIGVIITDFHIIYEPCCANYDLDVYWENDILMIYQGYNDFHFHIILTAIV